MTRAVRCGEEYLLPMLLSVNGMGDAQQSKFDNWFARHVLRKLVKAQDTGDVPKVTLSRMRREGRRQFPSGWSEYQIKESICTTMDLLQEANWVMDTEDTRQRNRAWYINPALMTTHPELVDDVMQEAEDLAEHIDRKSGRRISRARLRLDALKNPVTEVTG